MQRIYLDHSATTPVDEDVVKAMLPYFTTKFGNPSSIHHFGQEAMSGVDEARSEAAKFLNCQVNEVVFTSGSTEANNLAIHGLVKALRRRSKDAAAKYHVITSVIEHDSVLEPIAELERTGVEVTHVPVKANGIVEVEKIKEAITDNTILVSIMYVNSEVGSIQPIREIGKSIRKINEKRLKDWQNTEPAKRGEKPQLIYFHTDATQAANFLNCDVEANFIDLLSLSSHKIYGPKGVGLLYARAGTPLQALQLGGHHEGNRRSGTINAAGIVGFGRALKKLTSQSTERNNKKIGHLRDILVEGIIKNVPDVVLNTERENATPAHAHFSFVGVEGESILIALDLAGVSVSTGSACASNSLKASHVLIAMGIRVEIAHSSIRFTLGKHNTEAEIKSVIKTLPPIISRLRKISPDIKF